MNCIVILLYVLIFLNIKSNLKLKQKIYTNRIEKVIEMHQQQSISFVTVEKVAKQKSYSVILR